MRIALGKTVRKGIIKQFPLEVEQTNYRTKYYLTKFLQY
jgi:hypothetical protein